MKGVDVSAFVADVDNDGHGAEDVDDGKEYDKGGEELQKIKAVHRGCFWQK